MLKYTVYLVKTKTPGYYYVGWTNNTTRRWAQHREGRGAKFTRKHGVEDITVLCMVDNIEVAVSREKYYTLLLKHENPKWFVSCGMPLKHPNKVLREFGQELKLVYGKYIITSTEKIVI